MSDKVVPVSIVFLEETKAEKSIFPENVVIELKNKFSLVVRHRSQLSPTILGSMTESNYNNANQFLEQTYPKKFELGIFG